MCELEDSKSGFLTLNSTNVFEGRAREAITVSFQFRTLVTSSTPDVMGQSRR